MLFAESESSGWGQGWSFIITAIGVVFLQVLQMIFTHFKEKRVADAVEAVRLATAKDAAETKAAVEEVRVKAAEAAERVKEVKEKAAEAAEAAKAVKDTLSVQGDKTDQKLDGLAVKVEEVRNATNGLTEALGAAKHAQGTAEGTAVGLRQGRAEGAIASPATPAGVVPDVHIVAENVSVKPK